MLLSATKNVLDQVLTITDQLNKLSIDHKEKLYINLRIGCHVRHVTDHFLALKNGLHDGVVDYNMRHRDSPVEREIDTAKKIIMELIDWINSLELIDSPLEIISEIDSLHTQIDTFDSNIKRELLYLINHTIHHSAYMSLIAKSEGVEFPKEIGLAPGTATFLRNSAA